MLKYSETCHGTLKIEFSIIAKMFFLNNFITSIYFYNNDLTNIKVDLNFLCRIVIQLGLMLNYSFSDSKKLDPNIRVIYSWNPQNYSLERCFGVCRKNHPLLESLSLTQKNLTFAQEN
jgi:hypothetical protein